MPTETTATLLLLVTALAFASAWRDLQLWRCATVGALLGVLAMCRAEMMLLAAVVATLLPFGAPPESALSLTKARRAAQRFGSAGILIAAFVMVLAPWAIRNHAVLGGFVPVTTDGWRTAWLATHPGGWLEWRNEEPPISIEANSTDPLDRSRRFREATIANLRSDPSAYVWMTARRVLLLWVGGHSNVIVGLEAPLLKSRGPVLALKILFVGVNTILVVAGLAGLFLTVKRWRRMCPMHVLVLIPSAVYVLLVAVPRYHLPLLPFLLLFVGCLIFVSKGAVRASPDERSREARKPLWSD